jgi:hypothetical protein
MWKIQELLNLKPCLKILQSEKEKKKKKLFLLLLLLLLEIEKKLLKSM